jgi:hypothetical protein
VGSRVGVKRSHLELKGTAMISTMLLSLAIGVCALGQSENPAAPPDLEVYKAAAARAGHDPQAHVRLALWCESHGLSAERIKQLALAVLYDPSNALARGLLGSVAYEGNWRRPEQVIRTVQENPDHVARVQDYLKRRVKTPDRAEDQWKLALWCDQNGLKQQATAHLYAVVQLDPSRDAAWKRLGFKKTGGRWDKPERLAAAKAEAQKQHKANIHWKAVLEKLWDAVSGKDKAKRAEAEKSLSEITDPRAVPMIWVVLGQGGAPRQTAAVRLLTQIDSPGASQALALLALMSPNAQVRSNGTKSLRLRDPREFTPVLIGFLRDPIKYRVRPVNGPGSPGELQIENPDAFVKRFYSPPPPPSVSVELGDRLAYDASGLPVLIRTNSEMVDQRRVPGNAVAAAGAMFGLNASISISESPNPLSHLGLPAALSQKLAGATPHNSALPIYNDGGPAGQALWASLFAAQETRIPIGQMMLQAQQVAQVAEQQLERDARALDAYNLKLEEMNRCVREVLVGTVGKDFGTNRTAWQKWMVDLFGYSYTSPSNSRSEKPTYYEDVPLEVLAPGVPILTSAPKPTAIEVVRHSCFGAGTPVQTIDGPRKIEDLRAGDPVLSQDTKTGELKYKSLVTVYHNPPNAALRIELDTESIVVTGIHRLWKAGHGWVMARELKPGDTLRNLGGTSVVKSVAKERVQPVFNLRVADGDSFFVGNAGILAHDNSLVNPTPSPFDAPTDIAKLTNPSQK